jgi:hypothetical protein
LENDKEMKKIFTAILCMTFIINLSGCGKQAGQDAVSKTSSINSSSNNSSESVSSDVSNSLSETSSLTQSSVSVKPSGTVTSSKGTSTSSRTVSISPQVSNNPNPQALKKPNFVGISPTDSVGISESEWLSYRELGIKSMRVHLQYGNIGSSVTSPNFSKYDVVVNRAKAEGIEVTMLLSYESYPSISVPLDLGWGPIMKFTNSIDLIQIAQKAILHFKTLGVKKWEIWNEQNGMWNIDVNSYAQLLTQLYEKCKYTEKWDTTAIIAFGGLDAVNVNFVDGVNGTAQNYVRQFYMSTAYATFKSKYKRSPFDAFCIHPYNTIDVDADKGITKNVMAVAIQKTIINTMDNNGDTGMPIWITEYGNQDSDDKKNARAVYESILAIYNIPQVETLFWFKYCYVGSDYSIVRETGVKRPSYYSFRDAVLKLKENERK